MAWEVGALKDAPPGWGASEAELAAIAHLIRERDAEVAAAAKAEALAKIGIEHRVAKGVHEVRVRGEWTPVGGDGL